MLALVIGGSGFLGEALSRRLLEEGHSVRVYDRQRPRSLAASLETKGAKPSVEFIEGDVRDQAALEKAMQGTRWVFHTASLVSFWRKDRAVQWDVNVNGTIAVIKACKKAGVERLIYTSTVSSLGFAKDPRQIGDENTPFNWGAYHIGYMDSKRAAEQAVIKATATSGAGHRETPLNAVCVLPGTIFGGDSFAGIHTNNYIVGLKNSRILLCPKGGINCVGLNDVVSGHLLAAEHGVSGQKYILGGENVSYADLFERIATKLGVRAPKAKLPVSIGLLAAKVMQSWAKISGTDHPLLTSEMVKAANVYSFYQSDKAIKELAYKITPLDTVLDETIKALTRAKAW